MLVMGGNDSPSAADVTAALEKVGVDVDAADLKRFLAGVEGKDLAEIMAAGKEKLAKFGGGGGGGGRRRRRRRRRRRARRGGEEGGGRGGGGIGMDRWPAVATTWTLFCCPPQS